jgi:enamine deaminase RidA (YjgF/YER057c/UK114 family)
MMAPLSFGREPADAVDLAASTEPEVHVLDNRTLPLNESADLAQPALLWPRVPMLERWLSPASVSHHRHGCVRYATDGRFLHGTACVHETAAGGLEAAAERAYAAIFEVLSASNCNHLARLWNYMADINEAGSGLERYRQFNVGRQRAFLAAERSAFAGAPAACAMGTRQGPLTVHFLAGRTALSMVENPRQLSAYHYPERYGPRSPTFSRAAVLDLDDGWEGLFISGTASIVGHESLHMADVRRQAEETLANIDAILQSTPGRAHRAEDLCLTVYLRHAADLEAVREVIARRLGARSRAVLEAAYLRADICRAELLVEIEAHSILRRDARA